MTVSIKAHLNPDDQARAEAVLAGLVGKTSNLPGGLKVVGEALLRTQNARFISQSDPDGKPWAKLRPLTVEIRGSAGPILRRSGQLMRSGAWQVSGSTLRIGVNTPYAAVQQFGAVIKPVKGKVLAIPMAARRGGRNAPSFAFAKKVTIPPRPIVGFGTKDELAAHGAIEDWLALPKP